MPFTRPPRSYGSFCPVAQVSDLLMHGADLGESLRCGLLVLDGDRELALRFERLITFEEGSGVLPLPSEAEPACR